MNTTPPARDNACSCRLPTIVLTPPLRQDKKSGRVIQGYFVTAYRNLTSVRALQLQPNHVEPC